MRLAPKPWDAWAAALAAGAPDESLAEVLREELQSVAADALAEQQRRDVDWQPVRVAVGSWLETVRAATPDKAAVATLKVAEVGMTNCTAALRDERMAPVVQAAQENWKQLPRKQRCAISRCARPAYSATATFDVSIDGAAASVSA